MSFSVTVVDEPGPACPTAPARSPSDAVELACRRAARRSRRSAESPPPPRATCPMASKCSSDSRAGRSSSGSWRTPDSARCFAIRSRTVSSVSSASASPPARDVGRRLRAAACRAGSRASTCRAPPATCGSDSDVTVRMLPAPAARRDGSVGRQRDPPEIGRRTRSGCRSASPAARSRTCSSAVEQIDAPTVFAKDAVEEQLRSSRIAWRSLSSKFGNGADRAPSTARCAATATGRRNCCTNARPSGRPACGAPAARAPAGVLSVPHSPPSAARSSGMLLQRKNDRREASSRSLIR